VLGPTCSFLPSASSSMSRAPASVRDISSIVDKAAHRNPRPSCCGATFSDQRVGAGKTGGGKEVTWARWENREVSSRAAACVERLPGWKRYFAIDRGSHPAFRTSCCRGGSREECAVGQRPIGSKAHLSSRRVLCTTSVGDGPVAEPVGGSHLQNRSRHCRNRNANEGGKRDKPSSDVAVHLGQDRTAAVAAWVQTLKVAIRASCAE
jgi:hypothetical protein